MLQLAIVNSSESKITEIEMEINKALFDYVMDYKITNFQESNTFYRSVESKNYNILIIDATTLNSTLIRKLRQLSCQSNAPFIILTCSIEPYLEDLIGINIFAFIKSANLKIYLSNCISSCFNCLKTTSLYFKITNGFVNINQDQIVYFECNNRKLICHTKYNQYEIIGETLKSVEKKLQNQSLMYINRSIMINLKYLKEMRDGYVCMNHSIEKLYLSKEKERIVKFLIQNRMNHASILTAA